MTPDVTPGIMTGITPDVFSPQPVLLGPNLRLQPLRADDFDGLATAASDPKVLAGHPAPDRYKRDVFAPYFQSLLASEATLLVVDRQTTVIIGCSRYYHAPDHAEELAIGFTFLASSYWGGDCNREMKTLMLNYGFGSFDRIWFHIDPRNLRSQKATAKLGALHRGNKVMDLGGGAQDWMCYAMSKVDWQRMNRP